MLDAVLICVCVWVEAYEDTRHSSGVLEMFYHLSALAYALVRPGQMLMLVQRAPSLIYHAKRGSAIDRFRVSAVQQMRLQNIERMAWSGCNKYL